MYKLISEYGNDIQYTESERKRDRLLSLGYREVKEEKKAVGEKKNVRKNKNSAKAD